MEVNASPQMWVDFNDIEHGRISTLREFVAVGAGIHVGQQLVVGDAEGNTCLATIRSIDEKTGVVVVDTDLSTFVPAETTDTTISLADVGLYLAHDMAIDVRVEDDFAMITIGGRLELYAPEPRAGGAADLAEFHRFAQRLLDAINSCLEHRPSNG